MRRSGQHRCGLLVHNGSRTDSRNRFAHNWVCYQAVCGLRSRSNMYMRRLLLFGFPCGGSRGSDCVGSDGGFGDGCTGWPFDVKCGLTHRCVATTSNQHICAFGANALHDCIMRNTLGGHWGIRSSCGQAIAQCRPNRGTGLHKNSAPSRIQSRSLGGIARNSRNTCDAHRLGSLGIHTRQHPGGVRHQNSASPGGAIVRQRSPLDLLNITVAEASRRGFLFKRRHAICRTHNGRICLVPGASHVRGRRTKCTNLARNRSGRSNPLRASGSSGNAINVCDKFSCSGNNIHSIRGVSVC
mmetsp:Transcript_69334/g.212558  ORF Transcript_69334/g.212558 Transcript_69334/m.212558 type:complete len:298 (+) Transcript_69334:531-1424(+)